MQGLLLTFGEVRMDMFRPMSELTADLKSFFLDNNISPFDFEEMQLVASSDTSVWIPQALFSEDHKEDYLKPIFPLADGMACFSNFNEAIKAYNVFAANTNIETAFKIVLPGIEVYSQMSVLASQQILQTSLYNPVILLHQRQNACDFIVCRDGKLLLSNTFAIQSDDERLYRSIELMKGLKVEDSGLILFLCGDVSRSTYASMRGYFPQIKLYNGRPLRYMNPDFQSLKTYQHVLVLS